MQIGAKRCTECASHVQKCTRLERSRYGVVKEYQRLYYTIKRDCGVLLMVPYIFFSCAEQSMAEAERVFFFFTNHHTTLFNQCAINWKLSNVLKPVLLFLHLTYFVLPFFPVESNRTYTTLPRLFLPGRITRSVVGIYLHLTELPPFSPEGRGGSSTSKPSFLFLLWVMSI